MLSPEGKNKKRRRENDESKEELRAKIKKEEGRMMKARRS